MSAARVRGWVEAAFRRGLLTAVASASLGHPACRIHVAGWRWPVLWRPDDLRRLATGRSMVDVRMDGLADADKEVLVRGQIALDEAVDRAHPVAAWVKAAARLTLALAFLFAVAAVFSDDPRAGRASVFAARAGMAFHLSSGAFLLVVVRKGVGMPYPCCSKWPPRPMHGSGTRHPLQPTSTNWPRPHDSDAPSDRGPGVLFSVVLLLTFGGRRGRCSTMMVSRRIMADTEGAFRLTFVEGRGLLSLAVGTSLRLAGWRSWSWRSPTCVFHSICRGSHPVQESSPQAARDAVSFEADDLAGFLRDARLADYGLFGPEVEIDDGLVRIGARAVLGDRQAGFTATGAFTMVQPAAPALYVRRASVRLSSRATALVGDRAFYRRGRGAIAPA